jgi:hypothetical protein
MELAKEVEKKKAPLYDFEPGVGLTDLREQLHPYAKKLITARKACPLWYFLPEASREAGNHAHKTVESNALQLATTDEGPHTITLLGTHSTRPSPNAIPDSRLTWAQVQRAKSAFLDALPLGGYPVKFIEMFARFYANMDMHEELRELDGDKVMAQYHALMRQAWYDANESGHSWDLSVISEKAMDKSRREIQRRAYEKALAVSPP